MNLGGYFCPNIAGDGTILKSFKLHIFYFYLINIHQRLAKLQLSEIGAYFTIATENMSGQTLIKEMRNILGISMDIKLFQIELCYLGMLAD